MGAQARDTSVSSQAWSPLIVPRKRQLGAGLCRLGSFPWQGPLQPWVSLTHQGTLPSAPPPPPSRERLSLLSNEITSGLETQNSCSQEAKGELARPISQIRLLGHWEGERAEADSTKLHSSGGTRGGAAEGSPKVALEGSLRADSTLQGDLTQRYQAL